MFEKIIIDADLCIKLDGSAKNQLEELVNKGIVKVVSDDELGAAEKTPTNYLIRRYGLRINESILPCLFL